MNRGYPRCLVRAPRARRRPGLVFVLLCIASHAHAAGGHHAVDDATMLDPGQCQVETWIDRENGGGRKLLHVGPACRVGPVELGLNVDRARFAGAAAMVSAGPQVKWARPLDDAWSAGVVVSAGWQDASPRFVGTTIVFPLTWQVSQSVLAHANVGRDFRHQGPDYARAGVALEWAPLPEWSFVTERFREAGVNYWRAGARYVLSPTLNVDLSQARGLGRSAPGWWTLGLNWVVDR